MAQHKYPFMEVEDYLALDRNSQDARYEYYDGELSMLAGGSTYHATIIMNLSSILHSLLRRSSCSNSRLRMCTKG